MSGLLQLHRIAAARGDGLHPELLELLEQRAHMAETGIVEIESANGMQAGPAPLGHPSEFLPGNMVSFRNEFKASVQPVRKTSKL